MLNAEVLRTLFDPETKTTLIDSVIVALSDKDLPKLCTKVSEIEVVSVCTLPGPVTKTSARLNVSLKDVVNEYARLSVTVGVSEKLVVKANVGALSPMLTILPLLMFTSVLNSSEGLAVSSSV